MALPLSLLRTCQTASPEAAWSAVFDFAWQVCTKPLAGGLTAELGNRNRCVAEVDLFLATAGWDLWETYETAVRLTADALADWWREQDGGRAVLILDGLSLRECPWILQGAERRGYVVSQARATGAELPAETTPFANALGYSSRSALGNNGAPPNDRFPEAHTDSVDLPFEDCLGLIGAQPSWIFWHHWPDKQVHGLDGHGKGVDLLAKEAAEKLQSEGFWRLVERLTTGRRLLLTSDHGYAASGRFADVSDSAQAKYLKAEFKAGRSARGTGHSFGSWTPPIDLDLDTRHGKHRVVLGQRKWKAQGGYPTLTHGGLTVLEVAVPFIELSRPGEA